MSTDIPSDLRYSKEDEWVRIEGDIATIGITDYAQDQLSDVVYVELPASGDTISIGETFGVVESVKAASDLYMPASGTITAVNEDLPDAPELVNDDPYGEAWMIKVQLSDPSELDSLMDATQYEAYIKDRG